MFEVIIAENKKTRELKSFGFIVAAEYSDVNYDPFCEIDRVTIHFIDGSVIVLGFDLWTVVSDDLFAYSCFDRFIFSDDHYSLSLGLWRVFDWERCKSLKLFFRRLLLWFKYRKFV